MEPEVSTIKCPECGAVINVSDMLVQQLQDQVKKDFEAQFIKKDEEFKKKELLLKEEKENLSQERKDLQLQVDTVVKSKLSEQKLALERTLRKQIEEEKSDQVKSLETELNLKSEQLKDLNKTKADLARLHREKLELKEQLEAENEKKLNEILLQEREKIRATEEEKSKTEVNKRDKLIYDLNKKLQDQEQLKKDFVSQIAKKEKEYREKEQNLKEAKEQLEKTKEDLQNQVDVAVKQKLSAEKAIWEKVLRGKIDEEKSEQVKSLETELNQKSEQLKELNKTKADLARLQREKDEMKEQLEAEAESKFNELLGQERVKIKVAESEKNKLDVQKRDKLIEDLTKRLDEAQTKLEQGSNKLTGEVTEIELRDFLRLTYPIDNVQDVASGIRGADVVHFVRNNVGQICGSILYERKQTQAFNEAWVAKLKADGRNTKADILVIVTFSMPRDNQSTHFRDGVWVCLFDDLLLLTTLLRDGLIKQSAALVSQQNKGSKMELLYDYLLSQDFVNNITGIVDAFKKMDHGIQKEKSDAIKRFAEREAHIWQAKQSILSFWGRVEGIAADGLSKQVKMLDEAEQGKLEE